MSAAETATVAARPLEYGSHSPCVGICDLDPQSGWCRGCARTGVEISGWPGAGEAEKRALWAKLPERLRAIGASYHLKPWSSSAILDWIAEARGAERGVWWIGGATGCGTAIAVTRDASRVHDGERLVVRTADDAALAFASHDKWRAFGFGDPDRPSLVALALPKGRVTIAPAAGGVLPLGADVRAIEVGDRELQAFDLGVGRDGARVVLRTGDAALIAGLGRGDLSPEPGWTSRMPARTHLIHETECARVEVAHLPSAAEREATERARAAVTKAAKIMPGWAALVAAFVPEP